MWDMLEMSKNGVFYVCVRVCVEGARDKHISTLRVQIPSLFLLYSNHSEPSLQPHIVHIIHVRIDYHKYSSFTAKCDAECYMCR